MRGVGDIPSRLRGFFHPAVFVVVLRQDLKGEVCEFTGAGRQEVREYRTAVDRIGGDTHRSFDSSVVRAVASFGKRLMGLIERGVTSVAEGCRWNPVLGRHRYRVNSPERVLRLPIR